MFVLSPKPRTVFLDRDGVINEKMPEGIYVTQPSEFQLISGVAHAISLLNQANIRVIVVTNQRGIAKGLYDSSDLEKIHASFQEQIRAHNAHVDAIFYCPHDKNECNCRKPLPGLFEQASSQFPDIEVSSCVMIGDSWSDIQFGNQLGMRTIFIEVNPERQRPGAEKAREEASYCCNSLSEAIDMLI